MSNGTHHGNKDTQGNLLSSNRVKGGLIGTAALVVAFLGGRALFTENDNPTFIYRLSTLEAYIQGLKDGGTMERPLLDQIKIKLKTDIKNAGFRDNCLEREIPGGFAIVTEGEAFDENNQRAFGDIMKRFPKEEIVQLHDWDSIPNFLKNFFCNTTGHWRVYIFIVTTSIISKEYPYDFSKTGTDVQCWAYIYEFFRKSPESKDKPIYIEEGSSKYTAIQHLECSNLIRK